MVGIPELFSFNDHSLHWRVPPVRSRRTSSGSSLLAEILDIVMTETGPPIATPKPFRYRPVPLYPEDWESVCSAQDIVCTGGSGMSSPEQISTLTLVILSRTVGPPKRSANFGVFNP